ncbi:Fibrinogen-like protein A [Anopheles sinensis]|uniref:Fibrinogen-like protein A n=1 Tax=Anopheles sinensis TaxID=74873 RepID=A0A084VPA5_ANOSI|nr:Fibrinogen-like protein A [Anopheles sinensis]
MVLFKQDCAVLVLLVIILRIEVNAETTLDVIAQRLNALEKNIESKIADAENRINKKLGFSFDEINAKLQTLQQGLDKQATRAKTDWQSHSENIVKQVSKQIQKTELKLVSKGSQIVEKIQDIHSNLTGIGDCREAIRDGLYTLHLPNGFSQVVRCDKGFAGEGWILIYKRMSSTINFTQSWSSYVEGFGNPFLDYWIGLENLHRLTSSDAYELNLNSFESGRFEIGGADEDYRITKSDQPDTSNSLKLMERQVLSLRNAWAMHSANIVEQVSDQIQRSESNLQSKGSLIVKKIHDIQSNLTGIGDCRETKVDGLYTLQLPNRTTEMVRCDRGFTGDGWILIYKRVSSNVNFTRDWNSYVQGFGNPFMDYWIGLESLHRITTSGAYEINVNSFECGRFEIGGAEENYRITKSDATYSRHKLASILKQGSPFNTFDRNELGEDNQEYLLQHNFSFWGDDYTYNLLRNRIVYDEQFSIGKRWIAIRRIVTNPERIETVQEIIEREMVQYSQYVLFSHERNPTPCGTDGLSSLLTTARSEAPQDVFQFVHHILCMKSARFYAIPNGWLATKRPGRDAIGSGGSEQKRVPPMEGRRFRLDWPVAAIGHKSE